MPPGLPPAESQEAIWEWFQNEGVRSFAGARPRLAWLARRLRTQLTGHHPAVLDLGVGAGTFEELGLALGLDVHCVDPSARAIEGLRERLGLGEKARVGRAQALPFADGAFEGAVASEVLEHLDDEALEQALAELARVLRPGGLLVGSVPAREDLAAGAVVCPRCTHRFHRWGHVRTLEPDELGRRLARAGFTLLETSERPFPCFRELNWKGRLGGALRLLLWRFGVHGREETLVFAAARQA
mgnify:CR=1 FL=1